MDRRGIIGFGSGGTAPQVAFAVERAQAASVHIDGRELVNFGSNDYLGLAGDPRLAEAVAAALKQYGWGSGASPLILGHAELHRELEERLAEFEGTEAALLFTSGFAANSGTIAALAGPGDAVFADRKNHASLFDGCRLSRADVRVYPHGDWQALDELLGKAKTNRRRLIVSDSLFSMDGDFAPLKELAEIAERHAAMLVVDEAHATGVFGPSGRGVCELQGVEDRVPVRIGTLSKALGGIGGFVAGSRALIEWVLNRARPFVFSTAMPAAVSAAGLAALEIVKSEPWRRIELLATAAAVRRELAAQGWSLRARIREGESPAEPQPGEPVLPYPTARQEPRPPKNSNHTIGNSASQILPVVVGKAGQAVALSQELRERGFFVPAIRPPTVPEGEACLRISLNYAHSPAMIDRLLGEFAKLRRLNHPK